MSDMITDRAENEVAVLILAHGAGAGMQSPFMADMAALLAAQGITVVRFDFPYMQTIAETGKRRPPDKIDKLEAYYKDLVEQVAESTSSPVFIGGKSMGGRVSTMILEATEAKGAVVFGYPFHPPGKPEKLRTEHLVKMTKPVFINQGERDTFGTQSDVDGYNLSGQVTLHFLPDGDHSLKPRKSSGHTLNEHMQQAASASSAFINRLISC